MKNKAITRPEKLDHHYKGKLITVKERDMYNQAITEYEAYHEWITEGIRKQRVMWQETAVNCQAKLDDLPSEEEIRQEIVKHCGVEDRVFPLNWMAVGTRFIDGIPHELTRVYLNTSKLAKAIHKRIKESKCISLVLLSLSLCLNVIAKEIPFTDENCIRAVIGESSSQGFKGMLAVACGIRNRGTLKGVYGLKSPHIDLEPNWVWKMAKRAWEASESLKLHSGTHWENIKAFGKPYWVDSMVKVYQYKDHVFYKEVK